jgi:hypothetical protein
MRWTRTPHVPDWRAMEPEMIKMIRDSNIALHLAVIEFLFGPGRVFNA